MERRFTSVFWVCESRLYGVMAGLLVFVTHVVHKHEVTVSWSYITGGRCCALQISLRLATNLLTFTVINFYCVNTSLQRRRKSATHHYSVLTAVLSVGWCCMWLLMKEGRKKMDQIYSLFAEDDWIRCSSLLQLHRSWSPFCYFVNTEVLISLQASGAVWLTVWNLHLHVAALEKTKKSSIVLSPLLGFASVWCVAN